MKDFQMFDIGKERDQELFENQIRAEIEAEEMQRAYIDAQNQMMADRIANQQIQQQYMEENARNFASVMPSDRDMSAVSLNDNIDNNFVGMEAANGQFSIPKEITDTHMNQVITSMDGLKQRKVLLINTVVGTGSVGRLVWGLCNTLVANGYECMVAYGRGEAPSDIMSYRIDSDLDVYFHGFMSRMYDRHGFYSFNATRKLISVIEEYDPDIIHLHNVHGYYLNIEVLFEYLKKCGRKIIWTLHDCWSFTGHCSHFEYIGCNKWTTGCYKCEQLKEYPKSFGVDNSKQNYEDKWRLFTGIDNLTIVTPSEWLADKVRNSFLKEYPVVVVPTGIDLSQFYPFEEEVADSNMIFNLKNRMEIRNKHILLGVANPWRERKGLEQFSALSKTLSDRYAVVLLGLNDSQLQNLPESIIGLQKTNSVRELAALYSMADIYVNLTLEDTFPTTNLEALACGTPVVTYKAGGSPESIDDTCGVVVERNSVQGVVAAIEKIITSNGSCYTKEMCVRRAMLYSKEFRFLEYIQHVYEAL